MQHRLLRHYTE